MILYISYYNEHYFDPRHAWPKGVHQNHAKAAVARLASSALSCH